MLLRELPGLTLARSADQIEWKTGRSSLGPVALPVMW
jgi:hypothetical protein